MAHWSIENTGHLADGAVAYTVSRDGAVEAEDLNYHQALEYVEARIGRADTFHKAGWKRISATEFTAARERIAADDRRG